MFVADPAGPAALGRPLDDARRLPRRGRRRRDQPLPRSRARRPHGPHPRPGRWSPAASSRWHGLVFGIVLGAARRDPAGRSPSTSSPPRWRWPGCWATSSSTRVWLKPLTPQNIVIGGAAGAVPPLVGWAAATGSLALDALYPFAIVFLWTPPHFWALALLIKDDYARTGVPMLPVVKGDDATRRQILAYAVILTAFTIAALRRRACFGGAYLVAALVLGGGFIALAARLLRHPSRRAALRALPVVARLPRAAVLRDGARPRARADRSRHRWTAELATAQPPERPRRRRDRAVVFGAHLLRRDPLHRMTENGRAPAPTELVYVPEPSWTPVFVAAGAGVPRRRDLRRPGLGRRRRGARAARAAQWVRGRARRPRAAAAPPAPHHGDAAGDADAPLRPPPRVALRRLLGLGRRHPRRRALRGPARGRCRASRARRPARRARRRRGGGCGGATSPSPPARGSSRGLPRSRCRSCGRRPSRRPGPRPRPSELRMSRSETMPGPGRLLVDDDRGADALLGHPLGGLAQRVAGTHREHRRSTCRRGLPSVAASRPCRAPRDRSRTLVQIGATLSNRLRASAGPRQ